jgi:hypothetical protein
MAPTTQAASQQIALLRFHDHAHHQTPKSPLRQHHQGTPSATDSSHIFLDSEHQNANSKPN